MVGSDSEALTDESDSSCASHSRFRVFVSALRMDLEEAACRHKMLCHSCSVFLVEGTKLTADLFVEFVSRDLFWNRRFLNSGATCALLTCVVAGLC